MALDGGFLHVLTNELNMAESAFVDKIYQPSKEELVFMLRKKGFSKRLYINIRQTSPAVLFTDKTFENPAAPPMFCMLLRKYLGTAKLIKVTQPNLERVLFFEFSATTELMERENITLAVELLSGRPNIILIGRQGKIIDSVFRTDLFKSSRQIQPGALYELPASQNKLDLLNESAEHLTEQILSQKNIPLHKGVLSKLNGVSPLVAREIAYLAANNIDILTDNTDKTLLLNAVAAVKSALINPQPNICLAPTGEVVDFSYIPIKQYSNSHTLSFYNSCSEVINEYYSKKRSFSESEQKAKDILKVLKTVKERIIRKTALRLQDLKKCENREQLRLFGELLKANLHNVRSGAAFCEVQNYYDENLALIKIPLNPALSPAANAAKYFKDYKKTYHAEQTLTELIKNDEKELEYIDSVIDSVDRAKTIFELSDIKNELVQAGYIKSQTTKNPKNKLSNSYLTFTSPNGKKVYVGKNNLQNDYLTTKLAQKQDLWFHVKNIAGSHVLLILNNEAPANSDIIFAATLAKEHSKAADSTKVAVDYTFVRNVKKPNGAKPGMVIYTTNKTVLID